ncbi:hypothetical protein N7535_002512 [Penicillium sp. DV-2018c]|nr:hypothetical protein N7461_001802 [Penicillium sp. DV-2018c]KAJ5575586.1 hypothetical protein N7535_002512 [Penicillium sp. DV-2018c]
MESKQKIREHIMGQIPETIIGFLRTFDSSAARILGDTPNSVLDDTCYLESIRPIVSEVEESLLEYRPDAQTRFLAVDIHPGNHSYFVLDLNNVDYDYETAHNDMAPIPVYLLRLSKRKIGIFRRKEMDDTLAERLAELHNGHGKDPLPSVTTVGTDLSSLKYKASVRYSMWKKFPAGSDDKQALS